MANQQQTLAHFDSTRIDAAYLELDIAPGPVCLRQHRDYGDALLDKLPKTSIQAVQYSGNNFCDIRDFMTQRAKHCVVGVPRYDEDCLTVNTTGSQMRLYVGEFLVHGEEFYIDSEPGLQRLSSSTQYCTDTHKNIQEHDAAMSDVLDNLTSCIYWARSHHNRKVRILFVGETYYILLLRAMCAFIGCEILYTDSKVSPDVVVTCHRLDYQWPDKVLNSLDTGIFDQAAKPMLVNVVIPNHTVHHRQAIANFMKSVGITAK